MSNTIVVDPQEAQAHMCLQSLAATREAMTGLERIMLNPDAATVIAQRTVKRVREILEPDPTDPGTAMDRVGVLIPFDPFDRALGEGRR